MLVNNSAFCMEIFHGYLLYPLAADAKGITHLQLLGKV